MNELAQVFRYIVLTYTSLLDNVFPFYPPPAYLDPGLLDFRDPALLFGPPRLSGNVGHFVSSRVKYLT